MKASLSVYERLCRVKWLAKSYSLKFLFIANTSLHPISILLIFQPLTTAHNTRYIRYSCVKLGMTNALIQKPRQVF